MTDTPIYIDDNILYPPFTIDKCEVFVNRANENGKNVIQYGENRYAIAYNEIMGKKEVEIDVPDYDAETGEQTGTHKETIIIDYPVLNPNYEQEQADKREAEFNRAFFNTSLGYVRRSVTMADGSKKDFLSDLLPVISMGVQSGMPVNILTYDKPPFDEDVTDWEEYQHQVVVTPQFIQECFLQLSNDFLPINEEE